jgi:hypothetical protein
MFRDEERLSHITVGSEAYAVKPRALVIVLVLYAFQSKLIFEEVLEEPSKASGRERLAPSVIDPSTVIGIEPGVLMFIVIGAVKLMRAPNIHCCQGFALVIRAIIQKQRLVGPFRERVGIDKAIRSGLLQTRDGLRCLLQ